jgi:hypothetical protein
MERRNFFKLAPLGLLGMAAAATNGETEPTGSVTKKAMVMTITGPDGKHYHPLVVAKDDDTYEAIPMPKFEPLGIPQERFRISNNGLGIGISASSQKMVFVHNGNETFSL